MKDATHPHKVSVLSGKGGTGKTFVSVNLFAVTADALYVDTDVEEPNGFFYFDVDGIREQNVEVFVPHLDEKKCDGTQACVKACKFNAMAYIDGKLMVFDDLCHSCGACMYACPNDALSKTYIPIGKVKESTQGPHILWGEMEPGRESGVPIVEQLNENIASAKESLVIVDSPPGVGCAVIEAVKDSDYALVVAEPSLFGLHNMKMTVRLLEHLGIPFGIVINKYTGDDNPVSAYLAEQQMSAIATIPYTRRYAEMNARGEILVEHDEELRTIFNDLSKSIRKGWAR